MCKFHFREGEIIVDGGVRVYVWGVVKAYQEEDSDDAGKRPRRQAN